jgi:hypothetical protein
MRPQIKVGDTVGLRTDGDIRITKKAPKPLLADAKVGDPCKRRDGKWVQIYHISDNSPAPIMCKSNAGGYDSFLLDGTCPWYPIDRSIIEWQPLAPEGTAEWGKQMLLLGKKIKNISCTMPNTHLSLDDKNRVCIHTTPSSMNDGGDPICYIDFWILYNYVVAGEIGWQIYEPKIAEKPLLANPKEGTAEWAKQMMLLGRVISRTNNNDQWKLELDSVYRYCIKNAKWLLEADIKCWTDLVIDTGWKIYEPEPKFEVGQFVEYHNAPDETFIGYIEEIDNGDYWVFFYSDTIDLELVDGSLLSAFAAKDVVLDFGNGIKGVIEIVTDGLIGINEVCHNSRICVMWTSFLTEPMQSIVEAVLERQEIEEEG